MHHEFAHEIYFENRIKRSMSDIDVASYLISQCAYDTAKFIISSEANDDKLLSICNSIINNINAKYKRVTEKQIWFLANFLCDKYETAALAIKAMFPALQYIDLDIKPNY